MNTNFSDTVLVLNNDGLGQADTALSHKLVISYFRTLIELGEFAAAGVPLIACRTCLDFYALLDRVVVGEVGNMLGIIEAQLSAAKVITL